MARKKSKHKSDFEEGFAMIETLYGGNYPAMIERFLRSFAGHGRVMLLPEKIADALYDAKENSSRQTWENLKKAFIETPPPGKKKG